jgi:hypothetical protein
MVIVAIPLLVLSFLAINRHYRLFARRLRAGVSAARRSGPVTNRILLVAEEIDVATERALWYARRVGGDDVRAIHVPGRHTDTGIPARWFDLAGLSPRLEVVEPDEGHVEAVLEEVWKLPRGDAGFVTVVLPERFRRASLAQAVLRSTFRLKLRLLAEPNVVVTDVPAVGDEEGPATPDELAVRILVSDVHAATLRAVNYAATLGVPDTRAVSFALDPDEASDLARQWRTAGIETPLDLTEAPYRDIGEPLRAYLDPLRGPGRAVNVVMPEVVVRGRARLLHNQRALYVKRLLLFEPHVILSSVPYQVFR